MKQLIHVTFILILLQYTSIKAQSNLNLIDYHEAVKVISSHEYENSEVTVIAIIDGGVNTEHNDLKKHFWINKNEIPNNNIDDDLNGFVDDINGWNFRDNTNDISNYGIGSWHGTPINGIIGTNNINSLKTNTLSTNTQLMNLIKGNSVTSIIASLDYAYKMRKLYNNSGGKKGAFIVAVNCSWGKDLLWASDYPDWCAMYDKLGSVGILSIHSVPNNNVNVDVLGDMPTTCSSNYLITVTNSNLNDEKIYDAGFGRISVDLAAPGNSSYTTLNTGEYGYFEGTSAAAPYVTGTIGLLYLLPSDSFHTNVKKSPAETASLIKSVILSGTDPILDFTNLTVTEGRLNAFNSIKLLCDSLNEEHLYKTIFEPFRIISTYPNPAKDIINLQIESSTDTEADMHIIGIDGKILLAQNPKIQQGINTITINLTGVLRGLYILRLTSNEITQTIKLVIR